MALTDRSYQIKKSDLSIAAMVLGIVSIVPLAGYITSILAIIFGQVSLNRMERGEIDSENYAMAKTGRLLGIIFLCVWVALAVVAGILGFETPS